MDAKDRQRWAGRLALIVLTLIALSRWLPAWRRTMRIRQLRQQARHLVQRVAAMGHRLEHTATTVADQLEHAVENSPDPVA